MRKWIVVMSATTIALGAMASELGAWKEASFESLDRNKDGKVTRSEYVAYHKEKATKTRDQFDLKMCEQRFKKMDKDGNNSLTPKEFSSAAGNDEKKAKKDKEGGEE